MYKKRLLLSLLWVLFIPILLFSSNVNAISSQDLNSIYGDSIYYWPNQQGGCGSIAANVTLVGSDNEQQAFNYFVQQGLNDVQAAAVVGNLMDESHMDPTIMQKGGDSNNPVSADPLGWGIAQWTPGSKIISIAQNLNVSAPINQLATQLGIVWLEMTGTAPTGYQNLMQGLKQINDLFSAVSFFQHNFEGGVDGQRQQDAAQAFQLYGSSGSNSGSTTATTATSTCASAINCTSSSGTSSANTVVSSDSLSQTRQNVLCIASQELALWESQPGYPNTSFSEAGYLKYSQNRTEEWCADFVSWVYSQAGYSLQSPDWNIAYVPNIQSVGEQNQNFHWHPAASGYVPKPGDLAIHGSSHVNIFISSSGGVSTYIGGDQGSGPYPGGSVVSTDTESGYYAGGITGYVSPD